VVFCEKLRTPAQRRAIEAPTMLECMVMEYACDAVRRILWPATWAQSAREKMLGGWKGRLSNTCLPLPIPSTYRVPCCVYSIRVCEPFCVYVIVFCAFVYKTEMVLAQETEVLKWCSLKKCYSRLQCNVYRLYTAYPRSECPGGKYYENQVAISIDFLQYCIENVIET